MTAEACALCHGAGQIAEATPLHDAVAKTGLAKGSIQVLTADFTPDGTTGAVKPTITFTVKNAAGAYVDNWGAFNFTVAQLVPGTATDPEHWQNFINGSTAPFNPSRESGGTNVAAGATTGTLTTSGDVYTYTYATDISNQAAPAVPFDANATVRIGIQIATYSSPSGVVTPAYDMANGVADFKSSSGTAPFASLTRYIATTDACNQCHGRLTVHGRRVEVNYCATCHNYKLRDTAGNAGDLSVFIHKIHGGKVETKASTAIFGGIVPAEVTFPQDIRHCDTCHKGADGARWYQNPTRWACTSCHDATWFGSPTATPTGMVNHAGGSYSDDSGCLLCHGAGKSADIQVVHATPAETEAAKYRIEFGTIANTAPGQTPTIQFRIVNPLSTPTANAPYAVTDAPFTQGSSSSLALLIGLSNADFQNTAWGKAYGQPLSINLLNLPAGATLTGGPATDPTNGWYTLTSSAAIPASATGSGTVAIQGHPAFTPTGGTVTTIPMKSASKAFAITDSSAKARRVVVDINKCNACHFNLSLHGNNRTGDITTCTICHNTEATDGSKRAGAPTPYLDGRDQQGIDFKYLIHSIHGTALGNGIVVYGYNPANAATGGAPGLPNDFRDVTFPQVPSNCNACHVSGATPSSYLQPQAAANGTSTNALAGTSGGVANLRTTKYAATCGACHGTATQTSHIQQMGGAWDVTQAQINAVNQ